MENKNNHESMNETNFERGLPTNTTPEIINKYVEYSIQKYGTDHAS